MSVDPPVARAQEMARVLVIDDDAEIRELIRSVLAQAGYEVIEANGVASGLRRLGAEPVDVVVTDIIMPDQDGLEAIREIRRSRPEVKIIAISGGGRHLGIEVLRLATGLGANLAVAKPFKPETLRSAVQQVVTL